MALIALASATPLLADDTPDKSAATILGEARELIADGKREEAEAVLVAGAGSHPASEALLLELANLYEHGGRKEEAMRLYGRVLREIDAGSQRARDRFHRLFYEGRFPRELRLTHLGFGPVDFAVDTCRPSGEFGARAPTPRRLAYTTSLIFPEELSGGRAAPWVRLPPSGGASANMMYNRVAYGLLVEPGTDIARTRWMLGYPSSTVLLSGADYSHLAARLMHAILRAQTYIHQYLAIDATPDSGGLFRAFLTEDGPTGAEQLGDTLFFYDVDHDRDPLEWLREAFHEIGHLLLPQVGPFKHGERWGEGELGERLLLQWLAEEAGLVAGMGWPSEAATAALDRMWGEGRAPISTYLREQCRIPLNAWLTLDPEDFAGQDGGPQFAAFCLFVQAAHGRAVLGSMLREATGSAPEDFMAAYKSAVAGLLGDGALRIDAGALNPVASALLQPAREGAVRRESIVLDQGGRAAYRVYLPAGEWALKVDYFGGAGEFDIIVDEAAEPVKTQEGAAQLGRIEEGWHDLVVVCASAGPVEMLALEFRAGGETEGP